QVGLGHRLLARIGPQAVQAAADIDYRLVERVAQPGTGVAADDQPARLGHEGRDVPDAAADDNVAALHRDAAAAGCVPLDHHQPAVAAGRGALRCISA